MEGVDEIDAFVIGRAAESRRRSGRRRSAPAGFSVASSEAPSGTPVHLPIALQPSTQSWRVIWVRAGMRAQLGERKARGRSTRPSTASRQSAKPLAAWRRYRRAGSGVAVGAEVGRHLGVVVFAAPAHFAPISRWTR